MFKSETTLFIQAMVRFRIEKKTLVFFGILLLFNLIFNLARSFTGNEIVIYLLSIARVLSSLASIGILGVSFFHDNVITTEEAKDLVFTVTIFVLVFYGLYFLLWGLINVFSFMGIFSLDGDLPGKISFSTANAIYTLIKSLIYIPLIYSPLLILFFYPSCIFYNKLIFPNRYKKVMVIGIVILVIL